MEKPNQQKEVISIAFEGMHRVGKGTHIEALKSKLAENGIPAIDIRGEGSRAGKGENPNDTYSEWWLKLNEELHKKQGDEDATKWDEAAYRLARELIVWRDRFISNQVKEAGTPFGALIVDRSLLSRAAFMKHRLQPPPEKIFSSGDLYPEDIQNRKKITADMILPDLIFELVAPKDVLIGRLDPNDPKYDFRRKNIENMYEVYMSAKSHLSQKIQERIVTIDSSHDQDAIFAEIENVIKERFPGLLAITTSEKEDEAKGIEAEIQLTTRIDAFLNKTLGLVEDIKPVSGGLVHHVFRIKSNDGEYYLKVRGNRFAGMPTIEAVPDDIRHEAKALHIVSNLSPDIFPHVVAEDHEVGMLLITSIMQSEDNLLHKFRTQQVTQEDMRIIGKTVRGVHRKLASVNETIRKDGDVQYYKNNLLYRLGSQKNEALAQLIQELSSQERILILGDLSPKNLGLVSGELRICDLDTAHRGNPIFDVGFFIGHVYLHGLEHDYPSAEYVKEFLKAYQSDDEAKSLSTENDLLLKRITLGTLLYRLNNEVVPYPLDISVEEKAKVVSEVNTLLKNDSVDWETIESRIRYAKSH